MPRLTTKDKIIYAALTLFSQKGYDGTSVDEIAEAVGIKGPSIYKHFKGKEGILYGITDKFDEYYERNFVQQENRVYPNTLDELYESSINRIKFTMHDENIQKIRKVLMIEQFRNEKIASMTSLHHIYLLQNMYENIFKHLMDIDVIEKGDAKLLAMQYISPITLYIHMYDREPEKENEIIMMIETYLKYFISNLRKD